MAIRTPHVFMMTLCQTGRFDKAWTICGAAFYVYRCFLLLGLLILPLSDVILQLGASSPPCSRCGSH